MLQELQQFFMVRCLPLSSLWDWVAFYTIAVSLLALSTQVFVWHWSKSRLGRVELQIQTQSVPKFLLLTFFILAFFPSVLSFPYFKDTDDLACILDKIEQLDMMWFIFFYNFYLNQIGVEFRAKGVSELFSVVKWEDVQHYSWTGKKDNNLTLKLENKTQVFSIPVDRKPEIDSLLADRGLDRGDPP